jgi:hypothetical protein
MQNRWVGLPHLTTGVVFHVVRHLSHTRTLLLTADITSNTSADRYNHYHLLKQLTSHRFITMTSTSIFHLGALSTNLWPTACSRNNLPPNPVQHATPAFLALRPRPRVWTLWPDAARHACYTSTTRAQVRSVKWNSGCTRETRHAFGVQASEGGAR